MNIRLSELQREQFVTRARDYIGAPWRHQGRSVDGGVDCIGLLLLVANDLGLVPMSADQRGYARTPDGADLLGIFDTWCERMDLLQALEEPGHIVVMRSNRYPGHVGITATRYGKPSIIHAYVSRRKVVEEPIADLDLKPMAAYAILDHGVMSWH